MAYVRHEILTASIAQQLAQQQTTVTQAAGNLTGAARAAAESNATASYQSKCASNP